MTRSLSYEREGAREVGQNTILVHGWDGKKEKMRRESSCPELSWKVKVTRDNKKTGDKKTGKNNLTSTTSASMCRPWLETKLARLRRHGTAAFFAASALAESLEPVLGTPSHAWHLSARALRCAVSARASLFGCLGKKVHEGHQRDKTPVSYSSSKGQTQTAFKRSGYVVDHEEPWQVRSSKNMERRRKYIVGNDVTLAVEVSAFMASSSLLTAVTRGRYFSACRQWYISYHTKLHIKTKEPVCDSLLVLYQYY